MGRKEFSSVVVVGRNLILVTPLIMSGLLSNGSTWVVGAMLAGMVYVNASRINLHNDNSVAMEVK